MTLVILVIFFLLLKLLVLVHNLQASNWSVTWMRKNKRILIILCTFYGIYLFISLRLK